MNEFLLLFLLTLLSAYALLGVMYAISLSRIKAKCRRITRELDQAFADAERVKDAKPQEPKK